MDIIRAYVLSSVRGLLVTATVITWIAIIVLMMGAGPESAGSLGLPLLITVGVGVDFLRFRRGRKLH